MTTKRTRRAARDTGIPAGADTGDDLGDAVDDAGADDTAQASADLAELAAQLPADAILTLWRFDEAGVKEWLAEQPVAGFNLPSVAARFGGGSYIIYLRKPNADGGVTRQGSKRFRIGGPSRYPDPDAPAGAAPAAVTVGAIETEKLQRAYGDLIQQSIRASAESAQLMSGMQLALLKSMTERPAPVEDKSATLLQAILLKLLDNKQQGPSLGDLVTLAAKLASRSGPMSNLKETLELIQTARELGGGEPAGPAWIPIASKALDALTQAVRYNPGPTVRQLPPADVVAEPAPAPAPPVEASPMPANSHPLLAWLAPQMPALIEHAQADHDPDNYAGVIVDQIPASHAPDVVAYLAAPDFLAQLQGAFPMIAPLVAWFSELRDNVVDRLQEKIAPPIDSGAPEVAQ